MRTCLHAVTSLRLTSAVVQPVPLLAWSPGDWRKVEARPGKEDAQSLYRHAAWLTTAIREDAAGYELRQLRAAAAFAPDPRPAWNVSQASVAYELQSAEWQPARKPAVLRLSFSERFSGSAAEVVPSCASSFYAQLRTEESTATACAFVSCSNWTYSLECVAPSDADETPLVLDLWLSHISFGAFWPLSGAADILLDLRKRVFECSPPAAPRRASTLPPPQPCAAGQMIQAGRWHLHSIKYQPADGCVLPAPDMGALHRSLAPAWLVMVGASHMRYMYDYLVQTLASFNESAALDAKHGDAETGNVRYRSALYVHGGHEDDFGFGSAHENATVAAQLELLLSGPQPVPEGSVVLVQFGSWDLHGVGLAEVIFQSRRHFLPRAARLARRGVSVFYLTPPAFGAFSDSAWSGMRNDAAYAALLQQMAPALAAAGGGVLDVSLITRLYFQRMCWATGGDGQAPHAEFRTDWSYECDDHVLCPLGNGRVGGPIGAVVTPILFAAVDELRRQGRGRTAGRPE